jgi:hypothetical protein
MTEDRIEAADRFRRAREARAAALLPEMESQNVYDSITVRLAGECDMRALHGLAERDGRPLPHSPVLVAEIEGAVLAARSLVDGAAIADPSRPTAHLAELLALRTAHLRGDAPARPRRFAGPRAIVQRLARSYS